jgi:hypothetical protein
MGLILGMPTTCQVRSTITFQNKKKWKKNDLSTMSKAHAKNMLFLG